MCFILFLAKFHELISFVSLTDDRVMSITFAMVVLTYLEFACMNNTMSVTCDEPSGAP